MNFGHFLPRLNGNNHSKFSRKQVFARYTLILVPIFCEQQVAWWQGKELWAKNWYQNQNAPNITVRVRMNFGPKSFYSASSGTANFVRCKKKEFPIKIWDSVLAMAKEIVLPNFISPPPPPSSYASNKNVLCQKLSAGLQTCHSKKRIELQLSLSV